MKTKEKKLFSVQNISLMAIFTALIAVCAWIRIPIEPVPFTLQTFAVFVTAGILGAKRGTISVVVYILLGFIGVPVLAGFAAGPAVVFGPTGGYLFGFIFTAIIIGIIVPYTRGMKQATKIIVMILAMIIGDVVCFALGTVWFMIVAKTDFVATLTLCVTPYLLPDFVKIIVATIIVDRVRKYGKIFD